MNRRNLFCLIVIGVLCAGGAARAEETNTGFHLVGIVARMPRVKAADLVVGKKISGYTVTKVEDGVAELHKGDEVVHMVVPPADDNGELEADVRLPDNRKLELRIGQTFQYGSNSYLVGAIQRTTVILQNTRTKQTMTLNLESDAPFRR